MRADQVILFALHSPAYRGTSVDTPEMHHADPLSVRMASPRIAVIRTYGCANVGSHPSPYLDSRGSRRQLR
jgi:hypothetical protein